MHEQSHYVNEPLVLTRRAFIAGSLASITALAACSSGDSDPQPTTTPEATRTPEAGNLLEHGTWHMPGGRWENGRLHISPAPAQLFEQDGTPAARYPAINEYGTSLAVQGDFAVAVAVDRSQTGPDSSASITFFGQLPILADEFIVPGSCQSARLTITDNRLQVSLQDGNTDGSVRQLPPFAFTPTPDAIAHLRMIRQGGQLAFTLNDQVVGSIDERGIFDRGRLWFGADTGLQAADGFTINTIRVSGLGTGTANVVDSSHNRVTNRDPRGFQQLVRAHFPDKPHFTIGAGTTLEDVTGDDAYRQIALGGYFGALTPQHEGKWAVTQPLPDIYDFTRLRAIVDIAITHGLIVQGHTLVWHEQLPEWVRQLPASQLGQAMDEHIIRNIQAFPEITLWDVVNEPLADGEDYLNEDSPFYRAMGAGYIERAFRVAHQANPDAMLCLNENGLEAAGPRFETIFDIARQLTNQGVPLCIGMQGHVYGRDDRINPDELRTNIRRLAAIGAAVRLSECDVYDDDGVRMQAAQYLAGLQVALTEPNVISYTTWAVSDRTDYFRADDGTIQQGHDYLFNDRLQLNQAGKAVQQFLSKN